MTEVDRGVEYVVDLGLVMKVQFLNMERVAGSSQVSIMVEVARGWVTAKV